MLGYLGPEGTFTHEALISLNLDDTTQAYSSVGECLDAVRAGQVSAGMVPIENSVEGVVTATSDSISNGDPLQIRAEVLLPVVFGLYVRPGTQLADVRHVITHPHAAAQVRHWLAEKLPQAEITEKGSTAAAAQEVSHKDSSYDAAICSTGAGELYGLTAAASGIADNPNAVTRFILVSRPFTPEEPCGHDKTSLVVYLNDDHPGGLMEVLDQFSLRGINLCRIESRPAKDKMGNYHFSIDAEGHVAERRLQEALMGLHRTCRDVVFLGSYARADQVAQSVKESVRDVDFEEADTWMSRILHPGFRGVSPQE
ncbi:MAG: prephenate dehydratase [Propionibacteriaceae bacterium]|jgi:prephenate dehydratase|nr:prephenate dehydratase [Propionibacteriaceae bacterium]